MTDSSALRLLAAMAAVFCVSFATPGAAGPRPTLAILPFSFLDTTGEPRDQRAEHAARLAALADQLRTGLGGSYQVVPLNDAGGCGAGDSGCILSHARQAGATLVLAGAVQKVSTMLTRMWVGAFDVETGKRLFYRDLNFRGDTDEAYRRATAFLVGEIEASPPRAP